MNAFKGKCRFSGYASCEAPWPIFTKLAQLNYVVGDPTPHASFRVNRFKGVVSAHAWFCHPHTSILLLTRYVPNVAKRSVWEQWNIEDQRPTDRPCILENFEQPYHGNGSSDPLHVWLSGNVFELGESNGVISGCTKSKMAAGRHLGKFRMAISGQRIIRSASSLVLG